MGNINLRKVSPGPYQVIVYFTQMDMIRATTDQETGLVTALEASIESTVYTAKVWKVGCNIKDVKAPQFSDEIADIAVLNFTFFESDYVHFLGENNKKDQFYIVEHSFRSDVILGFVRSGLLIPARVDYPEFLKKMNRLANRDTLTGDGVFTSPAFVNLWDKTNTGVYFRNIRLKWTDQGVHQVQVLGIRHDVARKYKFRTGDEIFIKPNTGEEVEIDGVKVWSVKLDYVLCKIIRMKSFPLVPLNNKVIVEPHSVKESTEAGVIIPRKSQGEQFSGVVKSVPESDTLENDNIQVGDTVFFSQQKYEEITYNDVTYFVMNELDLLVLIPEGNG